MMVEEYRDNVDLIPLLRQWRGEAQMGKFGIKGYVHEVQSFLSKLPCVLLLVNEGVPVGLMGISVSTSPTGPQNMANEHFWYIAPKFRGYARTMIRAAEKWAKEKGCSHLILNASYAASASCDKVSHIYELLKYQPFERVYIKEVA
jgi:hypothetical protein